MFSPKKFFLLMRDAFRELQRNNPLRMAGATAFFTTFSLPFIVIIIVQLFGIFVNPRFLGLELMKRLSDILGYESAAQIRETALNFRQLAQNWYVTILGFLFIVFVSTTLFGVIKDSLDQLWKVRVKQNPGMLFFFFTRLRSFAVILLIGILFLTGIVTEPIENFISSLVDGAFPNSGHLLKMSLNVTVSTIIISIWFTLLFRFLADGRPSWMAAVAGGVVTSTLFTIGKLVLWFLLIKSNIGTLYGKAGSIVLILLFVFYTSLILYYGASFVLCFSQRAGHAIHVVNKAYRYKVEEIAE